MIDRHILPIQARILAPIARILARRRVSADHLTLAGLGIAVLCLPVLAAGHWGLGLTLILANRVLDGLDGALARQTRTTDRGAFADIAFDFAFYAVVPLGFALAAPERNALPAAVLIASFVGTGSSFLAFAAIAARRGMTAADYPAKGIYYLGGLTEGAETIAFFVAICLCPAQFPALAYGYSLLCAATTLLRWHRGWTEFTKEEER